MAIKDGRIREILFDMLFETMEGEGSSLVQSKTTLPQFGPSKGDLQWGVDESGVYITQHPRLLRYLKQVLGDPKPERLAFLPPSSIGQSAASRVFRPQPPRCYSADADLRVPRQWALGSGAD